MKDLNELAAIIIALSDQERIDLGNIIYEIDEECRINSVPICGDGDYEKNIVIQAEFDIILKSCSPSKLRTVKEMKEVLGVGLRDAKWLADSIPCVIMESVPHYSAMNIKKQLERDGVVVELK